MILKDEEIIRKLGIRTSDRVLDIGGSMMQHPKIKVDTVVDLLRPEESPYNPSKLLAKNFVRLDITRKSLPFKNKEFDVVLCTHTLEDLPSPFLIMDEMQRVAKKGLIVTPSMGTDMTFGVIDYTNWLTGARRTPGEAHHKWFFIKDGKKIKILPKIYSILYTSDFQITGWGGEKEMVYFWRGKIEYEEFSGINIHAVIDEYQRFLDRNNKYIRKGTALVFVDNPYNLARAWIKLIFKRGAGYKYRAR